MMKIRTISRTEEDYCRKSTLDIHKVHRNRDPSLHPFDRAREYTKAVVATKLNKIFAKPFIAALDGHKDGVYCMSTIRNKVVPLISGSCDGEIRVWDLSLKSCVWSNYGHAGFVRGVTPDVEGSSFYSCGDDKLIKQWSLQPLDSDTKNIEPVNTIISKESMKSIDHHWQDKRFATSGESICIWDAERMSLLHTYKWGTDSILSVRFNPAENSLVASTSNDRGVCLYDIRAAVPMKKIILPMNSNQVAWNPREPFNFVLANEDYNLYTFDMRKLDKAVMIHKDHVSAVMDVAFSPTGREFVSGSYDRTIRIFNVSSGNSKEIYHTKRMQRVFSVGYSSDSQYVISGSDDTNIRVWKALASKPIGLIASRDERNKNYMETVKKRFSHMPEIKRMNHEKLVPKYIKKAKRIAHEQKVSETRKEENRKRHSHADDSTNFPERKKAVLKQID